MATVAERIEIAARPADALSGTPRALGLDRWIFVAMAVWYIAITLAGFIPDSVMKVEQVRNGTRPDFPFALHLHAVLMGAFLCLLLVQSGLVATGRHRYHVRLGIAGFVLAGAVVAGAIFLLVTRYHLTMEALQLAPASARGELLTTLSRMDKVLARQLTTSILFSLFMVIAFRARAQDPSLHKRLIFLAVAIPLSAATGRLGWLPHTREANTFTADLYTLVTIAPLFCWDVIRNRRVHRAYWVWLAGYVPAEIAVNLVRDTPWWHETARLIMGV